jgi:hypothetical protein
MKIHKYIKVTKTRHMATFTVRKHPELDHISQYDKDKRIEVIQQYDDRYKRCVKPGPHLITLS